MRKGRLTPTELLVVIIIICVLGVVLSPMLLRAQEAARRKTCQNNLKQWGEIFQMYVAESVGEKYPPIFNENGLDDIFMEDPDWDTEFTPYGPSVYPEYCSDPSLYFCPSDANDRPGASIDCKLVRSRDIPLRPKGEWCAGYQVNGVRETHPSFGKLDPTRWDDPSYEYCPWLAEDLGVWVSLVCALHRELGKVEGRDSALWCQNFTHIEKDFAAVKHDEERMNRWQKKTVNITDVWNDIWAWFVNATAGEFTVNTKGDHTENADFTVKLAGNADGEVIYRLRKGIERVLTAEQDIVTGADPKSAISIMWDVNTYDLPLSHPDGVNVLYMDGHVEFLAFPNDKHPATMANHIFGEGTDVEQAEWITLRKRTAGPEEAAAAR